MKILHLKKKSNKFRDFKKKEWADIHPKHYGTKVDWEYWEARPLYLEAVEEGKTVGALEGDFMAGVLHISELIIKGDNRGKGIGEKLISKAESWARENGGHKIYLVTGVNWEAVDFYLKLGFKRVTNLENTTKK